MTSYNWAFKRLLKSCYSLVNMESEGEKSYINELIDAQESNIKGNKLAKRLADNKQLNRANNSQIEDLLETQYISQPLRNSVYIDKNRVDKDTGNHYDSVDYEAENLLYDLGKL